jgi:hypothetical protein
MLVDFEYSFGNANALLRAYMTFARCVVTTHSFVCSAFNEVSAVNCLADGRHAFLHQPEEHRNSHCTGFAVCAELKIGKHV